MAPLATSITGISITTENCSSGGTTFSNDIQAFINGYAVIAPIGTAG